MYIFLFGHYSFDMWVHLLNHLYSGDGQFQFGLWTRFGSGGAQCG